jgi:hypothetical protein
MRRLAKPLTGLLSFAGSNPALPAMRGGVPTRAAMRGLALALALTGCVSRKLFIHSEPPGAAVMLDGRRVGTTPWEGDFGSYGARQVELEKPGYVRRIETIEIEMPWWQYPVLDFVTDLLLPWTLSDDRLFRWDLQPIDPEAGTWDDARAAQKRMEAIR